MRAPRDCAPCAQLGVTLSEHEESSHDVTSGGDPEVPPAPRNDGVRARLLSARGDRHLELADVVPRGDSHITTAECSHGLLEIPVDNRPARLEYPVSLVSLVGPTGRAVAVAKEPGRGRL